MARKGGGGEGGCGPPPPPIPFPLIDCVYRVFTEFFFHEFDRTRLEWFHFDGALIECVGRFFFCFFFFSWKGAEPLLHYSPLTVINELLSSFFFSKKSEYFIACRWWLEKNSLISVLDSISSPLSVNQWLKWDWISMSDGFMLSCDWFSPTNGSPAVRMHRGVYSLPPIKLIIGQLVGSTSSHWLLPISVLIIQYFLSQAIGQNPEPSCHVRIQTRNNLLITIRGIRAD